MARRLIGLDIGTNAVTAAEVVAGSPIRLTAFGQVALPRDAMIEGEIANDVAVTEAIKRLRAEVGLRKAPVRIGIASPRLVVRQIEMPVMSRADLQGALRFQIQDLIPIPVNEAVVDFAILDEVTTYANAGDPDATPTLSPSVNSDGDPVMRVLLAAAQQSSVLRLVEAVEHAGLPVESVDLIPLALVRSLGAYATADGGAEGIVSIGGGVSCVVVHEGGIPRFVRVLGTGGRALTDAISVSLEASPDLAESLKRQIGVVSDDAVSQAKAAIERPLAMLLDEIRSSLDYYRNQPGAARLSRVQLTGGGAQLHGVRERLSGLLAVTVDRADPRARLSVGDIGFTVEELPRLDPYLAAAVGLAIGDDARTPIINLLPDADHDRKTAFASKGVLIGAVGAAVLVAGLAVPTINRRNDANRMADAAKVIERGNAATQLKIDALAQQAAAKTQVEALSVQVNAVLSNDVSWATLLNEIARTMPNNVWLTSFQGTALGTGGAATKGSAASTKTSGAVVGAGLSGNVTFTATGLDFNAVADWLKRLSQMPSITQLWVPQAQKSQLGTRDVVTFQSTADLTDKARSNRSVRIAGGAK